MLYAINSLNALGLVTHMIPENVKLGRTDVKPQRLLVLEDMLIDQLDIHQNFVNQILIWLAIKIIYLLAVFSNYNTHIT